LEWITDFHVDALRLDAIHAIVDSSAQTFLEELGAAVHTRAAEIGRNAFLIPESNRNDPRVVDPITENGLGLDAVWNDDFHHSLHVLLTGEHDGYYEDYSGIGDLAASYRDGFLYAHRYSHFRQKHYGKSSTHVPAKRFVVFAQDHDQIGNRRLGDRLSQSLSLQQLKLAAGIVLLSPYLPLIFMGEEYGEVAPFQYFVSHGDPSLVEAVRQGRRNEFARFGWIGDSPDPAEESTFRHCLLNWDSRTSGSHRVLWHFYRELLRLRRDVPALALLDKKSLDVASFADDKVLFIKRDHVRGPALIIGHFDQTPKKISLPVPPGRWQRVLDSAEEQLCDEGNQPSADLESRGELRFFLSPWRFIVLVQTNDRD
jgi:maltooligosyltrehalose trehalohydrolase